MSDSGYVFKAHCVVDKDDYIILEASHTYNRPSATMYFTCVASNTHADDDQVSVGLTPKDVKKLRKFLKGWLKETESG